MADTLLSSVEAQGDLQSPDPTEVHWVDLLLALSKHKQLILKATLAALILSSIVAFVIPAKYTATARVLPPNQNQTSAAMLLSQIAGSNSAGAMLGGALNLKNPSDIWVAMLKSRTVEDALINKFDLRRVYYKSTYTDARKSLEKKTEITAGKEGVISIDYVDNDPTRARDIADAYVQELLKMSENVAVGEASLRRTFYEKQLEQEKNKLTDAEIEMKRTQQSTGLIVPGDQAKAVIEGIARLRGLITAKQIKIGSMRGYATDVNPQLLQERRELAEMEAQLNILEKNRPGEAGDPIVPIGKVPEVALEYLRKYRDFKYHETLYEVLAKQLELARLDEAKDFSLVQVLDHPVIPDKRSGPPRALIILASTLAGFFVSVFLALASERRHSVVYGPGHHEKLQRLRDYWVRQR